MFARVAYTIVLLSFSLVVAGCNHDNDVEIYREQDFLVTDLFPRSATKEKPVLIIYQGSTIERYLSLKEQKTELVRSGRYSGNARREIAWELGKLLSYPDEKIAMLIKQNSSATTLE